MVVEVAPCVPPSLQVGENIFVRTYVGFILALISQGTFRGKMRQMFVCFSELH